MKWWLYPTFGALACTVYFFAPAGVVSESIFVAIGASSLVAMAIGIRANRPASAQAWWLIAAGSGLWVLGDAAFLWIGHTTGVVPLPSAADGIYLLGYPVMAAGLYLLVHRGWRRGELGHVANSAIVMIAFGLLMWVFVVDVEAVNISTTAGILGVVYAAMDLYLLGLLVHFVGAVQWQSASFRLLTAATVAVLVADTASNVAVTSLSETSRTALDLGYIAYYVLAGTAALHPSMRALARPAPRSGSAIHLVASFSTPTVIVLTLATLTAPAVMGILLVRGAPVHQWGWGVVVCATVLVCLVFVRVAELLRLLHDQTESLRTVATTDTLTGKYNRHGLQSWMESPSAPALPLALLLLDIDRFQEINDTFGREIGDEVLCVVADRLGAVIGRRGAVGRIGADEFAVALRAEMTDAMTVAHEMHATLRRPITVRKSTLLVEASVGVACAQSLDDRSDVLIRHAGLAVHSAKAVQPRIALYDASMDRDNSRQLLLLSELTTAIDTHQLEVYYQLQVDLATMEATSVEALLRWNHPDRGTIEPDLFLPMAERTGLIRPLTDFVLTEALAQRQLWSRDGLELAMSVNVSTRNLIDTTIVGQIRRSLAAVGAHPEILTLEITETAAIANPLVAIESMRQLRELGITLAVDDYGTGYSSLSYLQRLPVQQLKIDKTFVAHMLTTQTHRVIVQSTIDLARTLGLTVTAEGVEDIETLLELRRLSCTTAQGYYLGRPVPGHRIPASVAALNSELKDVATRR
ncbi:putative bifunctional diguanylate cyclase/phosphodiesterase [Rhodococcoides yunnanense]|uniref:putative bifunctional diguanylate cyclase/phosphodiesterase n=1 Tax=Rhodococcoides yunnanense TaxID=278209 RepID=UPI0009350D9E|nr:GGDEF domain-containing phosphodiesterase [Rhodococcus yunnanensis]